MSIDRRLEPRAPRDGMAGTQAAFDAWAVSRPASVRELMVEFPLGTVLTVRGEDFYVVGWGEGDSVSISPVWLGDDYDESMRLRHRLHIEHVRDGSVSVRRYE